MNFVACMSEKRNAYGILVGNMKEEISWKARYRWEDNIKMCLKEMG
jgi:hypothetical protein